MRCAECHFSGLTWLELGPRFQEKFLARAPAAHQNVAWYYFQGAGTFGASPTPVGEVTVSSTRSVVIVVTADAMVGELGAGAAFS